MEFSPVNGLFAPEAGVAAPDREFQAVLDAWRECLCGAATERRRRLMGDGASTVMVGTHA